MSPELCLCSKNLRLLHLSDTDWLRARDILRSIFASLGGLHVEETRTSSFPCTSCNRRVDFAAADTVGMGAEHAWLQQQDTSADHDPDTLDDFPTKETSQKVYDNLDLMRGVEVSLNVPGTRPLSAATSYGTQGRSTGWSPGSSRYGANGSLIEA
jgi:hypothetical protein